MAEPSTSIPTSTQAECHGNEPSKHQQGPCSHSGLRSPVSSSLVDSTLVCLPFLFSIITRSPSESGGLKILRSAINSSSSIPSYGKSFSRGGCPCRCWSSDRLCGAGGKTGRAVRDDVSPIRASSSPPPCTTTLPHLPPLIARLTGESWRTGRDDEATAAADAKVQGESPRRQPL